METLKEHFKLVLRLLLYVEETDHWTCALLQFSRKGLLHDNMTVRLLGEVLTTGKGMRKVSSATTERKATSAV